MSPELGALAHTQSPLPLPAQDWFLAMDSCSLVPRAPPSLPPCQPFPETRSHKQVKTVESEAQLICHCPLLLAGAWVGVGGGSGACPMPS